MNAITREEKIMSGENLTPITRKEMFLAKAAGMDVETPEPITREEMFLSKIQGGSGGDGGSGGGGSSDNWFNDGNTHIWVSLHNGRISPIIGVGVNGTVTIDWGDGSDLEVLTGTNAASTVWSKPHNYSSAKDYVITLIVDGEMWIVGANNGSHLLRFSTSSDERNNVYLNSVKKIELGENVKRLSSYAFYYLRQLEKILIHDVVDIIGDYAFGYCDSLKTVSVPNGASRIDGSVFASCLNLEKVDIPKSVASFGSGSFNSCYVLKEIKIPDGMDKIPQYAFNSCYSLGYIEIPNGVTSIGNNAFYNCGGLLKIRFNHEKPPTISNSLSLSGISADCIISVPIGSLDAYKTATNYPSASKYIYIEED